MINNLFNIKNKAIHCATKELALETLSILDSMGYKWTDGSSLLVSSLWKWYESSTCYRIVAGTGIACNSRSELEPSYILKAEDFINLYKNNMQKSDIKSGMSVKLKNGEIGIVIDIDGRKIIQFENSWIDINNDYNQALKLITTKYDDWDIMEVYSIPNYECVIRKNLCKPKNLIWRREEQKELTMQEIADKFGIPVNDLKIKKD